MMSKDEKINILLVITDEINSHAEEVKKFIPSLLTERYQIAGLDYVDIITSIVDIEKIRLEKDLGKIYNQLTDIELDNLIILCGASVGNARVEIDQVLYDALEEAKDLWFDSLIIKLDNIIDHIQNGEFIN